MSTLATTRLNQSMEYALKNLVEYSSFGPGVSVPIMLALESRGLCKSVHGGLGLYRWEATEQGRGYYREWLAKERR